MSIIFWVMCVIVNGYCAFVQYGENNYKMAMASSFGCGWSVVFLMYSCAEYYIDTM